MLRLAAVVMVVMVVLAAVSGQNVGRRTRDECFPGEDKRAYDSLDRTFAPNVENFAYNFFRMMSSQQGDRSMIVSPYSVWSVLSLAYFGALGRTRSEIEATLGFANKSHTLHNWKTLRFYMEADSGGATLDVANRAYFSNLLDLNTCLTTEVFDLRYLDFRNAEAARQAINKDVSDTTRGRIPELISSLPPTTRFALINAVFFKGTWATQFNPELSRPQQFLVPPGRSSGIVQMMNRLDFMRAGEAQGLDSMMVELPYENSSISMYLLLPNDPLAPLDDLVSRLNPSSFATAVRGLPPNNTYVNISLPKFKLSSKFEEELVRTLSTLGINSIFNPTLSNLRGFTKSPPLHVDTAIHQATVEVNEEGTVATAATGLLNTRFGPQPSLTVAFNRPFVFLIVEKRARIPLFMGKVNSALDLEDI